MSKFTEQGVLLACCAAEVLVMDSGEQCTSVAGFVATFAGPLAGIAVGKEVLRWVGAISDRTIEDIFAFMVFGNILLEIDFKELGIVGWFRHLRDSVE